MGRPTLEIVVLAPDARGHIPALPTIGLEAAPGDRLLPSVLRAVHEALGLQGTALELFVPDLASDVPLVPALLVLEPAAGSPDGAAINPATLHPLLVERASTWAGELSGGQPVPASRPSWARPGWASGTADWLDGALARAGRARRGRLEQQRTWSLSALLRAETTTGAVWLKSCMPRFHAEPALGRWLSGVLPEAVPRVIEVDAARRLMLLEEMDGPTARDAGGEEAVPEAPMVLARIARGTAGRLDELRALGLQDRPLARIAPLLRPVLLGPGPVAAGGLVRERADQVVDWVDRNARQLARLGLDPMLVHGDFQSGNVAWDRGRLVVFDWSDAVVGHPLMDAAAWVWEADDERALAARWEAWVDAWAPGVPAAILRPLLEPVLGVGAAHQLLSLDGILRAMEPARRHDLAWSAAAYIAVLDRLVPRR